MKKISILLLTLASIITIHAEVYVKVNDIAALHDGDQILLAYEDDTKVSNGLTGTKKYLDITTASFNADQLTIDNPKPITLKKAGDYWNLYLGTKPIGHKSNYSDLDANQNTTTNFAISIQNGKAKIISQTPGKNNNEVFFAYNTSSPRFALYHSGSNMKEIALYRYDATLQPDKEVTSIQLSQTSITLREGEQITLTATLLPEDATNQHIEWGTSNAAVATVNNGVVTAQAKGNAHIWVKTSAAGLADTCQVTVLGALEQTTVTYNAVKDIAYLTNGAKVFIGTSKEGEDYIMGIYDEATSKNNIKGVPATYGDKRHTVTAEQAYAYTVQRQGDYIILVDADGNYLRPISDSKLRSSDILDNQAKWTINTFNQDDATVEIKNAAFTSRYIYNNCQGTNEIFNIYQGYDDSYLAKTILYANTAPEWVDRKLDSWMTVSDTLLDWGRMEPDTTYASDDSWKDWGDVRRFTITFNDLTSDINVNLTGHESFYCSTEVIKATAKQPVELSIYWETDELGVYTGELHLSTTTEGVEDIVIHLHAEAVPLGQGDDSEREKPIFNLSTHTMTFDLNQNNNYSDLQMFTFSASNLQKTLYCKWEHTGSVIFRYEYENACMEILAGDNELLLNDAVHFPIGYDYEEEEVLVAVDNLFSAGNYTTRLHFYSYRPDSKTEMDIDQYVTIKVRVASIPDTALEDILTDQPTQARKLLHNGHIYILRDGILYDALGTELSR